MIDNNDSIGVQKIRKVSLEKLYTIADLDFPGRSLLTGPIPATPGYEYDARVSR
jgi:hypothetical protein